jgi:Arc/MetJ family transcription regulator
MRTLIDVDETLLKYAMEELGTKTKRDTVNEALRRAAGDRLRAAYAEFWATRGTDPEQFDQERQEAWGR